MLKEPDLEVVCTTRSGEGGSIRFDIENDSVLELIRRSNPDIVVNCAGKIKPEIDEQNTTSVLSAIRVNSSFPHELRKYFSGQIVQIATDCVFSGAKSAYSVADQHDALDVYGKSKSLGEVNARNFLNIRVSIIGREYGKRKSLVEWLLGQEVGATINGFVNHHWNGVTTHAFAEVVLGLIKSNFAEINSGVFHLTPADTVTKYQLLKLIAETFDRKDLQIDPVNAIESIDRTLRNSDNKLNLKLWENTTFQKIPSVAEMLDTARSFN